MFQIQTLKGHTIKGPTIKDLVVSTLPAILIWTEPARDNKFCPVPFLAMLTKPATVANLETTCTFLESKSTSMIVRRLAWGVWRLEKLCNSKAKGTKTTMINLTLIDLGSRVYNRQLPTIPTEDTFPWHSSQQMLILRCMNPVRTSPLTSPQLPLPLHPGWITSQPMKPCLLQVTIWTISTSKRSSQLIRNFLSTSTST